MPYLPVELDALHKFEDAAGAARLPPGDIYRGHMRMWASVFRTERDWVSRIELSGFFPGCPDIGPVLEAFGFVEPKPDGSFRVKGADRLLGAKLARRKGGLAAKGNLKKGASRTPQPEASREPAGETSPAAPGSYTNHLTPITQHPTPDLFAGSQASAAPGGEKPKRRKEDKPPDPRHAPAVARLTEIFAEVVGAKYGFAGKDAKAVTTLLAYGPDDEIFRRWRIGLTNPPGFWRVATIHDLAEKWNGLAQPTARAGPVIKRADITQADYTSEAL